MNTETLDGQLQRLAANKEQWARQEIARKADLLRAVQRTAAAHARDWVEVSTGIKGIPMDAPVAGEEWASGPWAFINSVNNQIATLDAVAGGQPPLGPRSIRTERGRAVARVFPKDAYDRLLFSGYAADVWMQPGVAADAVPMASFYSEHNPAGAVGLILGAANITSIGPLDLLTKMFGEGQVCLLKMHPFIDALGPVFEAIFAPLIGAGYAAVCYGGADVGGYLCRHEAVDAIHVTGGERTHDAIVFGGGIDGEDRKRRNEPITTKTVTSELGNITPTIVVPGPWSNADVAYQAQHMATQKLHNSGFNCVASQVAVMAETWDRTPALVEALRATMTSAPARARYYPAAAERSSAFAAAHPGVERLGNDGTALLVTGLDAGADEHCFRTEAFGPMYGQTTLPGDTAAAFLDAAVDFCNDRLWGTLSADILVHPKTIKELGPKLGDAVDRLRYGTIGLNTWNGVGFLLSVTPWGGYPGSTTSDIQSGVGFVHNTLLFDKAEKSVVSGPFRPFPRAWLSGSFHLSPKPQWFLTNRQAHHIGRKITGLVSDPGIRHLPGLFASALRG